MGDDPFTTGQHSYRVLFSFGTASTVFSAASITVSFNGHKSATVSAIPAAVSLTGLAHHGLAPTVPLLVAEW
jgi:hypothetical protein